MSTMSRSSPTEKLSSLPRKLRWATASTRSPWWFIRSQIAFAVAIRSGVSSRTAPPSSVCEQISSISSTAPLVTICRLPVRSSTTTDMRRRVKSNGISSTLR